VRAARPKCSWTRIKLVRRDHDKPAAPIMTVQSGLQFSLHWRQLHSATRAPNPGGRSQPFPRDRPRGRSTLLLLRVLSLSPPHAIYAPQVHQENDATSWSHTVREMLMLLARLGLPCWPERGVALSHERGVRVRAIGKRIARRERGGSRLLKSGSG
jgi:hypothetical protein